MSAHQDQGEQPVLSRGIIFFDGPSQFLDAYNNKEDFEGLAKAARELAEIPRLGDEAFKKNLLAMASNAEQQEIDARTIEAGGNVQEALKDFIEERKGTDVAAKALFRRGR